MKTFVIQLPPSPSLFGGNTPTLSHKLFVPRDYRALTIRMVMTLNLPLILIQIEICQTIGCFYVVFGQTFSFPSG